MTFQLKIFSTMQTFSTRKRCFLSEQGVFQLQMKHFQRKHFFHFNFVNIEVFELEMNLGGETISILNISVLEI